MHAPLEPQAAVNLADSLLATFHAVEKLVAVKPLDMSLIAVLIAGAREAIEDEVKFAFPVHSSEGETSLSRSWISMLMVREIQLLSDLKRRLLSLSPEEREAEKPVRVFLCILIDLCSLLASPTLREPLELYFKENAAEPPAGTVP